MEASGGKEAKPVSDDGVFSQEVEDILGELEGIQRRLSIAHFTHIPSTEGQSSIAGFPAS